MDKCRCGKAIPPYKKGTSGPEKKWCSIKCCQIYRQLDVEAKKPKCICGKPIGKHKTKWCSTECNMQHHLSNLKKKRIKQKGKLTIRNCKYCGQFFMPAQRLSKVCKKKKCQKRYYADASSLSVKKKNKEVKERFMSGKATREDIHYITTARLRSRIWEVLKRQKTDLQKKHGTTYELLGCTVDEFRKHFKSMFARGMSWKRLAMGEIHIDHIRPCASFDLTKEEEQRKCFHWSNLQPLWAKDNLIKGAKIVNE
tara:strand:- start:1317 stop:2078 length:762 start_codon:yes stop_codon:yes gene_type:complete